jgi:hypothetical protein
VLLNEYDITPFHAEEVKAEKPWQAQSPVKESFDHFGHRVPHLDGMCAYFGFRELLPWESARVASLVPAIGSKRYQLQTST